MMPIVRPRPNPIVVCSMSVIDAFKKAGQQIPSNLHGSPHCPANVAYKFETKIKPKPVPVSRWSGEIVTNGPNFMGVSITA